MKRCGYRIFRYLEQGAVNPALNQTDIRLHGKTSGQFSHHAVSEGSLAFIR